MASYIPQPKSMANSRWTSPQMQMDLLPELRSGASDVSELWSDASEGASPQPEWKFDATESQQTFPPTFLDLPGLDARRVMENWGVPSIDPRTENALVLRRMAEELASRQGFHVQVDKDQRSMTKLLNSVALMPRIHPAKASVEALGFFSRERSLRDDGKGSVRTAIEQRYGNKWARHWWGSPKKAFKVFAIHGVVGAPGVSEDVTRILLSKMQTYALKEQRILFVPKWVYIHNQYLVEYYVRLGFEMVEVKDRLPELVYTGTSLSAEDSVEDTDDRHIMMGLKPWRDW